MAKGGDAKKLPKLVDAMANGDTKAMETFFEFVDVLENKKLKKDGRHALMMVVSIVELLLPEAARRAYAAALKKAVEKPKPEIKKEAPKEVEKPKPAARRKAPKKVQPTAEVAAQNLPLPDVKAPPRKA